MIGPGRQRPDEWDAPVRPGAAARLVWAVDAAPRGAIDHAAGERLRLATHAKVSLAYGWDTDHLLNLTWRRTGDELDLATLAGTPAFKSTNAAALRYTHRAAINVNQTRMPMNAIAEVSSVKATTLTASQSDFKQAVGIDTMVMPGLWLEFRYGRARSASGTGLENKALFTFKFSEDTSLEKQIK